MTNITPLNIPHKQAVDDLMLRIIDSTNGAPHDVLLAAVAEVITFLTTMEGTEHAYSYVVQHAHDALKEFGLRLRQNQETLRHSPRRRSIRE